MKKILLICFMIVALFLLFTVSTFAEDIIVSRTDSEEYGTVIQLSADPGLDNAKQYVSTLKKINDTGDSTQDYCILTDDTCTYYYVFPASYIVFENADGCFELYSGTDSTPGLVQAMTEFNEANGTEYYDGYELYGWSSDRRFDEIVRLEFTSDITYVKENKLCMRKYPNLTEIRFNHTIDMSDATYMFKQCSNLTTVVGFENVRADSIANAIFSSCVSLETIKLPLEITRIPDNMFNACGKLTIENLTECTKLTVIGYGAFQGGQTLVFTLPDTVTTIESNAFVAAFKAVGSSFTINPTSKLQSIGAYAFNDCRKINSTIYIPSTVTSIGEYAFKQCYTIQELENFENCQLTTIETGVFDSVSALKSLKLPKTVTTIKNAFLGNEKLTKVYIPKSVTLIEDTFVNASWNNQSANAVYIYTGNDITVLSTCSRLAGANIISASEYDETKSYTGVNLVVDFSHCVAYNNGVHEDCIITPIVTSYLETIKKISTCVECGTKSDAGVISPLFIFDGYSIPDDGRAELVVGFSINNDAIKEYESITKSKLNYGAFAALQIKLGDNYIFDEEGNEQENVVAVKIEGYNYGMFELKITGFKDDQKDLKIAMGAFITVTTEEKTEYTYLQGALPNQGDKYHFISYNDILNQTQE